MGSRQESLNQKFAMLAAGTMAFGSAGMLVSGSPDNSWAAAALAMVAGQFSQVPGAASGLAFAARDPRLARPSVEPLSAPDGGLSAPDAALSSVSSGHLGAPIENTAPAPAQAPFIGESSGRLFAFGDRRTTVRLWDEPAVGTENRPSSPLPFAGAVLNPPQPEEDVLPPEPVVARELPAAPPQEIHTLTSFDGTRTLTSGETLASCPMPPVAERAPFPPAPAVWNNPLRWLGTHGF